MWMGGIVDTLPSGIRQDTCSHGTPSHQTFTFPLKLMISARPVPLTTLFEHYCVKIVATRSTHRMSLHDVQVSSIALSTSRTSIMQVLKPHLNILTPINEYFRTTRSRQLVMFVTIL